MSVTMIVLGSIAVTGAITWVLCEILTGPASLSDKPKQKPKRVIPEGSKPEEEEHREL